MIYRFKRSRDERSFPSYSVFRTHPVLPSPTEQPPLPSPSRPTPTYTTAFLPHKPIYRLRNVHEDVIRAAIAPILASCQIQQLAQNGVVDGTAGERVAEWGKIQELLGVRGAQAVDEEPFLAMCLALAPHYTISKLEKLRAALVWRQIEELPPSERYTRDERFKRRFKGCLAFCKPFKVTGAISLTKLEKLVAWLLEKGEFEYARGFRITFWGLLRHSDLLRLRETDVEFSTGVRDEVLLSIIGGKGREKEHVDVIKACEARDYLLTAVQIARMHGDMILFARWSKGVANALIHEFAQLDGWDVSHKWSVHSLRHGCAAHLQRMGVSLAVRKQRGRWSSTRIAEWYARG